MALNLSRRKGWGLGECRYDINENALMEIEECDSCSWEEDCGSEDHHEHIKMARALGAKAYELACQLEDAGISQIA